MNMSNCMGNTSLHFATEYRYVKVQQYLLQKGANPNITNLKGYKCLEGINPKVNSEQVMDEFKRKWIISEIFNWIQSENDEMWSWIKRLNLDENTKRSRV